MNKQPLDPSSAPLTSRYTRFMAVAVGLAARHAPGPRCRGWRSWLRLGRHGRDSWAWVDRPAYRRR